MKEFAVLLYIVNLPKLCKTRKNIWIIFIYCLSFFNLWKDRKRLFLRKYYYFTSKIRNMKDYITYEHTKSKCQKCRVINEWVQINVTDRSQTHSNILLIRKRKKTQIWSNQKPNLNLPTSTLHVIYLFLYRILCHF